MKDEQFSFRARANSFKFSYDGLKAFFRREHNSWIHFVATIAVFIVAAIVGVDKTELLALVFAIGFVWVAEIFNTCIERIMDHTSPAIHPDVKFIKDLASGGVLVAAITALAIGLIVFIPKFFH